MTAHIVLVERKKDWLPEFPDAQVVAASEYLSQAEEYKQKGIAVINLCRTYRYLSIGYYCSLLGEARRHNMIPSVRTLTDLSSKAIYSLNVDDLDELVHRSLVKSGAPKDTEKFELDIFFGRCADAHLQELARQLFDSFRCPLLRIEFRFKGNWHIYAVKPLYLSTLKTDQRQQFVESFTAYMSKRWQNPRTKQMARFDLAILINPNDKLPPSSKPTLQKFIRSAKRFGINAELIEKKDYSRLAEYDGLFIRDTTSIDHYTYRFAKKAESEGMVVIDDPNSIVKCTNKVYLAELLKLNKVPTPQTFILRNGHLNQVLAEIKYPVVIKIPDGSFSRGVFKAKNEASLVELCNRLFKESDLLLAQEYLPTEFDWRVGILNGQPLYVCQYFMSKNHWQILRHDDKSGRFVEGVIKSYLVDDVPPGLLKTALHAANLIGDGFYGVDIKQTDKGFVVIEINDNPNIDTGCEDQRLGVALYDIIMLEFLRRMQLRRIR